MQMHVVVFKIPKCSSGIDFLNYYLKTKTKFFFFFFLPPEFFGNRTFKWVALIGFRIKIILLNLISLHHKQPAFA